MAVISPAQTRRERRTIESPLVAPLENGDRSTGAEFLRRYEGMPHVKKAELIAGIVYMPSPLRYDHAKPDAIIQTWLGTYAAHTSGVESVTNATVRFDPRNILQPDALLRLLPECGGQTRVDAEGFISGAPELIAEIASSSAGIDLHVKLRAYRKAGVREYLVWRTRDHAFDWFVLEQGDYQVNPPDGKGWLRSRQFPGLVLDVRALLEEDSGKVLDVLHTGLKEHAHGEFVKKLGRKA